MAESADIPVIDVRDITKKFSGRTVVDRVTLRVNRGEIFGFLGPNGSGKTTFMRMLCGLLTPDGGEGRCLDFDILTQQDRIKLKVGYMTQRFGYYEDLSIRENLDFVARIYRIPDRRKRVDESLERLGLASRQRQLVGELSGGWKQRLALSACLLHEPELLLLDEPTAGVDPDARRMFWDQVHTMAGEGITSLISTHYMDEAERCNRIAYIAYGKLMTQGSIRDVIQQAGLITWTVEAERNFELAKALRNQPGVDQVVAFGNILHISGTDAEALEHAIAPFRKPPAVWTQTDSSLEDVFIHLMHDRKDNWS